MLWDLTYLERIWCVFEVGVFLASEPESPSITIVPIWLLCMELVVTLTLIVFQISWAIVAIFNVRQLIPSEEVSGVPKEVVRGAAYFPIFAVTFIPLTAAFRKFLHVHSGIARQIADFRVASAKCSDECDRAYVSEKIDRMFGDASCFEECFRTNMSALIKRQFGDSLHLADILPFSMTQRLSFAAWVYCALDHSCGLKEATDSYRLHYFLGASVCWSGPCWDLLWILFFKISSLRLKTNTRREELVTTIQLSACCSATYCVFVGCWPLAYSEHYTGKLVMLGVSIFAVLLSRRSSLMRTCQSERAKQEIAEHEL
jgi:hypothetical protein